MSVFSTFDTKLMLCQDLLQIGNGVHFSGIDNVPNKTLVAFVASGGSFRIGYAYRFHSTLIVYYDDTPYSDMTNRPLKKSFPPVSTLLIVFNQISTDKSGEQLISDDLDFDWLDKEAIELLKTKLGAQTGLWRNTLDDVIDSLNDLSLESLTKALKYVKLGLPDVDINKFSLGSFLR